MSRLNIPGRWEAHYVGPNTPYVDEPSEMVPIGWRVVAVAGEDKEIQAEIPIDLFDADDVDVSEQVAKILAKALNEAEQR